MMTSLAEIEERWVEIAEIAVSHPNEKIIIICDRVIMAQNIFGYLENKAESAELFIGSKKTWDKTKRVLVSGIKKGRDTWHTKTTKK